MNDKEIAARNAGLDDAIDRFHTLFSRYFKDRFTFSEVIWILKDLKVKPPIHVHYIVTVLEDHDQER